MKLYTEEQVIALTKSAFTAGQNHNSFIFLEELKIITPIELPSQEEINEVAMIVYGFDARDIKDVLEYKAFKRGAKYVINKIGGNK